MNLKEFKEVVFKGFQEEKSNRKICNYIIIPEMKEKIYNAFIAQQYGILCLRLNKHCISCEGSYQKSRERDTKTHGEVFITRPRF